MLIKPDKLQPGDKVATVSPSWGGAGEPDIKWRYEQGVERLESVFGLEVIPMPNSLKGADYLYKNPKARAEDLMTAFRDPDIKGIFANIGGEESIRLIPYIDYEVIQNNPKILVGYSDITVSHLFCHKAGVSSFYGPSILVDFAENVRMDPYTVEYIERTLFSSETIGDIAPAEKWTSEFLEWKENNKNTARQMNTNRGYEVLQGNGTVEGRLIGGCLDVLEMVKGTELWPEDKYWEESIIFFETSEEKAHPFLLKCWLRNYGAQGIFQKANGIIFGKPMDEEHYEEYKTVIREVMKEFNCEQMPILYNLNFGHTEPKFVLPYGARAEINCAKSTFSILENGVT
ncbi:S66 family peptidase [Halobacillus massiliensis]|uniref:S66 family peptidase n=1 Tax=Halobacillus massiliensis TaxID=1926286 RepID=UPI0009E307BA|nr:S66 peptidase family protein [Halobacillus massiliensis]